MIFLFLVADTLYHLWLKSNGLNLSFDFFQFFINSSLNMLDLFFYLTDPIIQFSHHFRLRLLFFSLFGIK